MPLCRLALLMLARRLLSAMLMMLPYFIAAVIFAMPLMLATVVTQLMRYAICHYYYCRFTLRRQIAWFVIFMLPLAAISLFFLLLSCYHAVATSLFHAAALPFAATITLFRLAIVTDAVFFTPALPLIDAHAFHASLLTPSLPC